MAPEAPATAVAEAAAEEAAAALFAAFVAALTAIFCMTCNCNLNKGEKGFHNKGIGENIILRVPTTVSRRREKNSDTFLLCSSHSGWIIS
jgi:hypothetical protein